MDRKREHNFLMAHFAELDENNVVLRVIVVHNNELIDGEESESEQLGIDFCVAHFGGRWVQTSYNGNFRQRYAGIGSIFIPDADIFTEPQPYPSWTLDTEYKWQPPVAQPEGAWIWNEENTEWVEVIQDSDEA
jgi:hypothetical protein